MVLPALAVLAIGCDAEVYGMLTLQFDLLPTAITVKVPEALDSSVARFPMASGAVQVSPIEGTGLVSAWGLPILPPGYEYVIALQYASDVRADLPSASGAAAAPAQTTAGLHDPAGLLVEAGPLLTYGDGTWERELSRLDAPGGFLGALRVCTVTVRESPDPLARTAHTHSHGSGDDLVALAGHLEALTADQASAVGGGGHVH